jgi:signal transduction histidine kinase
MHSVHDLPWSRVAAFVRQHAHDVRNDLNSLDLEGALLAEMVTDEETKESVTRIRRQIRSAASKLKALSAKFSEPRPSPASILATDLFEIWQEQARGLNEPLKVSWDSKLGEESLSVDAALIALTLRELLDNAAAFSAGSKIKATAYTQEDRVSFELEESKTEPVDPEGWCTNPLQSTRRGSYGLGLWQARRIVEAHGGELNQRYVADGNWLVSTIWLPIA